MSDTSQGPGWWQASDGKWYPPEQAPAGQAPQTPQPPQYGTPPQYGVAPQYGAPAMGGGPEAFASFGQRFVAWLIDAAIMLGAYLAVFILVLVGAAIADALGVLLAVVGYVGVFAIAIYLFWLQGEVGGTPGKRLTGLKVVREDTGQVLGGGMGIVRQLAHVVDGLICYIGYLFPLWDPKRQTIADKLIGSVVLPNQPKMEFGPDIFKK